MDGPPDLPPLVGTAPSFLEVMARVSLAAPLARPLLVVGERGTGKELVAARLHYLSPRWNRPFVKLNCGAVAESLLASELFGHEAGAFTGAARRRPGRFELADGGTLFLDEIAQASMPVQEAILRVVEYGSFERVGGAEAIAVDVRLIAATNVDLPAAADAGRFRWDLLDRLAFDVVTLPPLRCRPEDIPVLAEHFAVQMTRVLGRPAFAGFTSTAMAALAAHDWPGNVRELKNVVERTVYRTARPQRPIAEILFDPFASPWRPAAPAASTAIPAPSAATPAPEGFDAQVRAFETGLLRTALAANQHHRGRAAEALGLSYHQLRGLLRKYGLD